MKKINADIFGKPFFTAPIDLKKGDAIFVEIIYDKAGNSAWIPVEIKRKGKTIWRQRT